MTRQLKLMFLFCALPIMAFAQNINVSGTVSDQNGEQLIGVSVLVKGTTSGTVTDIEGKYLIDAPKGAVLVFSYIGYEKQEHSVSSANLNVTLISATDELEEVIAIGYGTSKKKDVTGSISSINADKLRESVSANLDNALLGKIAGVDVKSNSGAPGAATSIRIRGASSINNTNEPLYVIDGIPMSGEGTSTANFEWGGGSGGQNRVNPLSAIAPSDIVSIDVLKDASATAIYGSAGANGVVIVTTKRGQQGGAKITYDGYVAMQTRSGKKLDMMNLRQFAVYQNQLNAEGFLPNIDQTYLDPSILGEGTDWQNAVTRNALMHSHNLSLVGGSEKTQYAASIGYTKQDGILINSDFERFNGRVSIDHEFNKYFKMGANLSYARTDENIVNNDGINGIIMQSLVMRPDIAVYDFNGNYSNPENTEQGSSIFNPVAMAKEQLNNLRRDRIMGNIYGQINILPVLNFRTEFAMDGSNNIQKGFKPDYGYGQFQNAMIMQQEDHSLYWVWRNQLNWNQTFGKHTVGIMAGSETSLASWEGIQLIKDHLSSNDIKYLTKDGNYLSNNGWQGETAKVSPYGRFNYNYDDRYLLTMTFRGDGSSNFGANHKWGFFDSYAFAWRISNEKFMEKAKDWMHNLKLRLGYGRNGNDQINFYSYGSTMQAFPTAFGTAYRMASNANPDLKWEASVQYNAGLDFSLFGGRINLVVDAYYKTTNDLLLTPSVSPVLGGSSWVDIATATQNIGKVDNKGIEIALNTHNIKAKKFDWHTNIVVSLNRNKVVALDNLGTPFTFSARQMLFLGGYDDVSKIEVGQPMGFFYGYQTDGLYMDAEDLRNSPKPEGKTYDRNSGVWIGDVKFVDQITEDTDGDGIADSGDGVINEKDKVKIGDPNPKFTFGFNNTFSFCNFDLTIGLVGSVGGDILNLAKMKLQREQIVWDPQLASVLDRAQLGYIDGDNTNGADIDNCYIVNADQNPTLPRFSNGDGNDNNRMSDRWIEDGSYLRIQNIALAYNFPKKMLAKAKISSCKLYFNAQNVYTFTKYSGLDPEIGSYNQSVGLNNVDFGRYPSPRVYTLGVNISF